MARYELSVSPNYVQDWTIVEAMREFFQNGFDQEKDGFPFSFEWAHKTAVFTSINSKLDRSTLLFGGGNKQNDDSKIGTFGEGYKLALLVLTRLGYKVVIYNRKRDEVWKPHIIKSKRYNSDLLVIDIEHVPYKGKDEDCHLVIKIMGITEEDIEKVEASNLFFHTVEKIETDIGDVLLESEYKGKIFVGGLFITIIPDLDKGYNFKPGTIKLDRDRNMASTFDICWATSMMWDKASVIPHTIKMMHEGAQDTKYVLSVGYNTSIREAVYTDFISKYPNGYPVVNQWEFDLITDKFASATPIIVDSQIRDIVLKHARFAEPELRLKQQPFDILTLLFQGLEDKYDISSSDAYLINQVLKASKEW